MTTTPDPRPRVRDDDSTATIAGQSCEQCGLHTLSEAVSCPSCKGPLTTASFGPAGIVWSSTVVRVPVPGRTPPYAVAYVDIVDGPRVLCHLAGLTDRAAVGSSVQLCGTSPEGDVLVEVTP